MNELYNERIIRNGKEYRYDPDYDCYYPVQGNLSTTGKYGWIMVTLVLCAVAIWVEYIR